MREMLPSLSPVIHWQDLGLHDLQTPREGEWGGQAVSDFNNKLVIELFKQRDALKADVVRLTLKVAELYKGAEEQKRRIKRLEEAGDALKAAGYFGGFGDAVNKWNEAKEVKQ